MIIYEVYRPHRLVKILNGENPNRAIPNNIASPNH